MDTNPVGILRKCFKIRSYETILLAASAYLLFFSVWRTYAIPVTPYDAIVGIDLVAKQAQQEGHIVSSIFYRTDFRPFLSTQPYYAPFTMLMQIIYRVAGLKFGQLWLGILTVSFFVFAYSRLCEKLHPIVAGFFLLLLITVPELYAYTFLLQTDFSNAVFFSIAMSFIIDFLNSKDKQHLHLACFFMAAACWSRTETILLTIPVSAILIFRSEHNHSFRSIKSGAFFLSVCSLPIFLWNFLFFKFYFPVTPMIKEQINWKGIYSLEESERIFNGINKYLFSVDYWGYFIYFFLGLWLLNLVLYRNKQALWPILWIVIFHLCFFIMLHHFTLMNIDYTFRRAIMKFLLFMYLMLGELALLQKVRRIGKELNTVKLGPTAKT